MEEIYFSIKKDNYDILCKCYKTNNPKYVILGIHGFSGSKESNYLKTIAYSNKNADLVTFDLPMHGESKATIKDLRINNCLEDIKKVVHYINIHYKNIPKCVIATSFGSFLTLLSLKTFKDYKIILRAPAIAMGKRILTDLLEITPSEFEKVKVINCPNIKPSTLSYEFYKDLLDSKLNNNFRRKILIIQGDKDSIAYLSETQEFFRNKKNIMIKVIKGAGHRFKNPGELEKIVKITNDYINDKITF